MPQNVSSAAEKKVSRNLESWLKFLFFQLENSSHCRRRTQTSKQLFDLKSILLLLLFLLASTPTRDRTIFYLNLFFCHRFFCCLRLSLLSRARQSVSLLLARMSALLWKRTASVESEVGFFLIFFISVNAN